MNKTIVTELPGLGLCKPSMTEVEIYIDGSYKYLSTEDARETAIKLNDVADSIDNTSDFSKLNRIIEGLSKTNRVMMLELLQANVSGLVFEAVEGREG